MGTPINARLHYHVSFQAYSNDQHAAFQAIQKIARAWISKKEQTLSGLLGAWFYNGGQWANKDDSSAQVRTLPFYRDGAEKEQSVGAWAMHYQHQDSTMGKMRYWYTDLGIQKLTDGSVEFCLKISHALNHEFVGSEPQAPAATVPRLVRDILETKDMTVRSDEMTLTPSVVPIIAGKVNLLEEAIFKTKRGCPIVVINGGYNANSFPVNADLLMNKLVGKAVVFRCVDDAEIGQEMPWFIPEDHGCRYHSIRVYQPNPNQANPYDARRHRYFSSATIINDGAEAVFETIALSLNRRFSHFSPDAVQTIADVHALARRVQLDTLRKAGKPTQEYIALLEETNQVLDSDNKQYQSLLEIADRETADLKEERAMLQSKLASLQLSFQSGADSSLNGRDALVRLWRNNGKPSDCLRALTFCFPDRIRILKSATSSAEESKDFRFTSTLWELLQVLATDYFEAIKNGGGDTNARSVFGQDKFAAKESETVMNSSRLRSFRSFDDEGVKREMFRHLKIGVADNSSETIRVHFDWDAERQGIVIGHCGPHLPLR